MGHNIHGPLRGHNINLSCLSGVLTEPGLSDIGKYVTGKPGETRSLAEITRLRPPSVLLRTRQDCLYLAVATVFACNLAGQVHKSHALSRTIDMSV